MRISSRDGSRRRLALRLLLGGVMLAGAAPASAAPLVFTVDPAASNVQAFVAEPLSSVRGNAQGTFQIISGQVTFDSSNPAATGHVTLTLDARSYKSDSAARDRAVTSSVLESDQYPTIVFSSAALSQVSVPVPNAGSAAVIGNLTLHGQTRPLTVPVTASIESDGQMVAEGEVSFRYTDYGISPPTISFLKAGDEVTIRFDVVARPAAVTH